LHREDPNDLHDIFNPKHLLEKTFIANLLSDETPQPQWNVSNSTAGTLSSFHFENTDLLDEFVFAILEDNESIINREWQNVAPPHHVEQRPVLEETSDTCFVYKLHLMLENAQGDNYSHIVSWVKDGTAFQVHHNKAFVEQVMPMFFDQSKYESFRRQLHHYRFKRESRDADRGILSDPNFLAGKRSLCEEIKRERLGGGGTSVKCYYRRMGL
jgi:hypothetical protein